MSAAQRWSRLSEAQRREFLRQNVWHPDCTALIDLEAKKKWKDLLPSTQSNLRHALEHS